MNLKDQKNLRLKVFCVKDYKLISIVALNKLFQMLL